MLLVLCFVLFEATVREGRQTKKGHGSFVFQERKGKREEEKREEVRRRRGRERERRRGSR